MKEGMVNTISKKKPLILTIYSSRQNSFLKRKKEEWLIPFLETLFQKKERRNG